MEEIIVKTWLGQKYAKDTRFPQKLAIGWDYNLTSN